MDEISASTDTLMRQASMTAAEYLAKAVDEIDERFGNGHSKSHPELVVVWQAVRVIGEDF